LAPGALAAALFLDTMTTEFRFLNNPDSQRAKDLLEERFGVSKSITDVVLVRAEEAKVEDQASSVR
jgi:hypothetical protein